MFIKETGEELLNLLDKIKYKTVIVEGKKDRNILLSFDFTKIITINHGLYETAEEISKTNREIIVLTDFDKEGNLIARKLTLFLQSFNCKVDIITRKKIGLYFAKLRIKTMEELKILR